MELEIRLLYKTDTLNPMYLSRVDQNFDITQ